MITITDKRKCCGCTACQQICPKHSIEMQEDEEGFLYPVVNVETCVDCGLCEKVCMAHNSYEASDKVPEAYNCKTKEESLRALSSSGGVFPIIASQVISDGGVVIGARFMSDWSVAHTVAETFEEERHFCGSKYVQSNLTDIFQKTQLLLASGRKVLFSGTPCQVAGLHHFLRKEYENLFTIDMVCHSIPSPKVWKMYLSQTTKGEKATKVTFRNKTEGWHSYGLEIKVGNCSVDKGSNTENLYMRGFLEDLFTRPSCSQCMARNYTSHSDIMLADAWGVDKYHPEHDDNKGLSQVLIITQKGAKLFEKVKNGGSIDVWRIPYKEVEDRSLHLPITSSTPPHPYREYFFRNFEKQSLQSLIAFCLSENDKRVKKLMLMKRMGRLIGLDKIYRIWKLVRK